MKIHYIKLIDEWNIKIEMEEGFLVKSTFTKDFEERFECSDLAKRFDEYINGAKLPHVKINYSGTKFQNKIWNELLNIPQGETRSYKEIAQIFYEKGGYQAVGSACNKNIYPPFIPCHRVVGNKKELFAVDSKVKEYLLKIEKYST